MLGQNDSDLFSDSLYEFLRLTPEPNQPLHLAAEQLRRHAITEPATITGNSPGRGGGVHARAPSCHVGRRQGFGEDMRALPSTYSCWRQHAGESHRKYTMLCIGNFFVSLYISHTMDIVPVYLLLLYSIYIYMDTAVGRGRYDSTPPSHRATGNLERCRDRHLQKSRE